MKTRPILTPIDIAERGTELLCRLNGINSLLADFLHRYSDELVINGLYAVLGTKAEATDYIEELTEDLLELFDTLTRNLTPAPPPYHPTGQDKTVWHWQPPHDDQ